MTYTLFEPQLPYAGTSGWSGSRTSEDRALDADKSGKTSRNQEETMRLLAWVGFDGLTWSELSTMTGWHHGTSSGCLSVLHKTHKIVRLVERRNRCKIYVLAEFAQGRDIEEQGRTSKSGARCESCGGGI